MSSLTLAVEALVFDFDGLIADTEGAQVEAARSVFADHNVEFPLDRWIGIIGTEADDDAWLPWLIESARSPVDRATAVHSFRQRNRRINESLALNPGVHDVLTSAASHGVTMAVASSSPHRWVAPKLEQFGIDRHFAHVVCREDAPRAKPHPDLYVEAIRRLGVRAEATVAFEDSYNGSLAAVAAGLHCVVVPHALTANQDFAHATAVITSLTVVELATTPDGVALQFSEQ